MSRQLLNVVQSNYKFSADIQVVFFFLVKCLYEGKTSNCQNKKKKLMIKQEMGLFVCLFFNVLCVAGLTDKVTGGDADM